ncbi:response regulator [Candidatus Pacearchaeota archaeon]|nr:response regulator [Candidatus Pacearchaeota archaeon]
MSNKTKIFIVDDDAASRMILADEFNSDKYEVHEFTDGKSCLSSIDLQPQIILLDVEMPEMNGYETCRQIKAGSNNQNVDVIFISSHDTTEEKLMGYDAGACDYLIKPIQHKELEQKISLSTKNRTIRSESAAGQKMAMETAMTAMTSAGEQGVVLDFLRNSYSVQTIDDLITMIVESVSKFDLENTIQLRTRHEVINKGTKEPIPPIEEELLFRLKDHDKIMSRGRRTIFNYGNISMLIKDMPEDDDKTGRYRDHLAILLEGAANRLDALEIDIKLKQLIHDSNFILQNTSKEQKAHKETGQEIMENMLQDLEESFLSWGLTEDQENTLVNIVQKGVDNSLEHYQKGQEIDNKMSVIIRRLSAFL